MSDLALAQKLLSDAKSLHAAGDTDNAVTVAYRALGCLDNAEEMPDVGRFIDRLEADKAAPKKKEPAAVGADVATGAIGLAGKRDVAKQSEAPSVANPVGSEPAVAARITRAEAVVQNDPSKPNPEQAESFAEFLAAGGYRGLLRVEEKAEVERGAASDTAQKAAAPKSGSNSLSEEDLEQRKKMRVKRLLFAAAALIVTVQVSRIYLRLRDPTETATECAGEATVRTLVMPNLRESNTREVRVLAEQDVRRLVEQRRQDVLERQQRSMGGFPRGAIASAGEYVSVEAPGDLSSEPRAGGQSASTRERQGISGNQSARAARGEASEPRRAKQGRGEATAVSAANPAAAAVGPSGAASQTQAPRGGRFFRSGGRVEGPAARPQSGVKKLTLPLGTEIKAALDIGITSRRHGGVLARVTAPMYMGGKVVIPAGAMLEGMSSDDGQRVYVVIQYVVIESERHALKAEAISGDMRGLVPRVIKATVEDRQNAEIVKGTLDVARELAVAATGSVGQLADRIAGGAVAESSRAQEPSHGVTLMVPAGQQFAVKVLP